MNAGQQLYPILSPLVYGRVYQLIRREGADAKTPYIVYTPVSANPTTSQDGFTGYEWVRVQIDIYHDDYDELDSLADAVIDAINTNIRPSELSGRQHLYDADSDLFRQSIDYEFFTKASKPIGG